MLGDWDRWLSRIESEQLDEPVALEDCTLLPPIVDPPNIYMSGANYADHYREMHGLAARGSGAASPERAILLPQADDQHDRPPRAGGDRRGRHAPRLGGRAGRRDRPACTPRVGGRRARTRRRLHDRQRRLGARHVRARGGRAAIHLRLVSPEGLGDELSGRAVAAAGARLPGPGRARAVAAPGRDGDAGLEHGRRWCSRSRS